MPARRWSAPTRVFQDPPGRPTTHSVRSNRMPDGSVVAMGALMYRDDPEKSVVNVPTLGYTEMELITVRSHDRGRTWSEPAQGRAAARRSGLRGLPLDRPAARRALGLADVDLDGLGRRRARTG